jgi:glycosyltransferase involved in cell wall biosynthesis
VVQVVTDRVLIDLHHTSQTDFATGIQRVARQVSQRWTRDHDVTLIGWNRHNTALRGLNLTQQHRALHGGSAAGDLVTEPAESSDTSVIVPWHCSYVLPELLAEPARAQALQALLQFSGSRGAMIGFDCVPLTSAETTAEGMSGGFSMMLAAIAHGARIAAISAGAANEYQLARCLVFPSLNEGFGLPVAEALASGTPVITSNFGSMKEIAAEGGALLVDPRDDADLTAAMRILICDDEVHARLSKEAAMRSTTTWEHYAAQTWAYLVDGAPVGDQDVVLAHDLAAGAAHPRQDPAIGAR